MAEQKVGYGYVYAWWNPRFPDLMKIGATLRTPQIRARELSGTGIPEPFAVIAEYACVNPFKIERQIHEHYLAVRKYGKKKEFFTLSPFEVIQHFNMLKEQVISLPKHFDMLN